MTAPTAPSTPPELFSPEELTLLLDNLDKLTEAELREVTRMTEELDRRMHLQHLRDDLIAFCQHMQPDYKVGRHHVVLAAELMALEKGTKDRVCVNIPPRHGKSQLVSIYYPAWFLGRNPNKKIMMVSHTADLAVDFGRKVRNLIDTELYKEVFPTVTLAVDSKSAGRWNTNFGGEYFATGIGSSIAGRGADLLLVDDPHSEQDVLNGNFSVFDKAYEWFTFGARTRLMPGGRVAVVQCMTGDTPVLRPDGSETPLRDIRAGDEVVSFEDGALFAREVLNHQSNGVDRVFTIKTTSAKTVRANERHPFLVVRDGELRWVRLSGLQTGDSVVSLTDAISLRGPEPDAESARGAKAGTATTASTQTPHTEILGTTGSGRAWSVPSRAVRRRQKQTASAPGTTTSNGGPKGRDTEAQPRIEKHTSSTATGSLWKSTTAFLRSKMAAALSVASRQARLTLAPIGMGNSAWTIATIPATFARSSATTATSQLVTQRQNKPLWRLQNTYALTLDTIESVTPAGEEEVFDIQVEYSENFIASGLVSHNTRWHMSDLTGRLVQDMTQNSEADQYEVVEFPAILDVTSTDPLTSLTVVQQKPLWPEFFDLPALLRTKASMPLFQWNAQYQQNPTAEEAALIKRDWWRTWVKEDPPRVEYIIMSLDSAAETHTRADYTALTVWGVFNNDAENAKHIILLNAIKRRLEFPDLKDLCLAEYRRWEPDAFIVEKKSSGVAVFQELRRMGLIVQEYTPHRGTGDKTARLNSVSDIIKSGMVWVPERRWAEEVVEEVAGFPFAEHDDLVDSTIMALMRFRQGGFIILPTDEPDEALPYRRVSEGYY